MNTKTKYIIGGLVTAIVIVGAVVFANPSLQKGFFGQQIAPNRSPNAPTQISPSNKLPLTSQKNIVAFRTCRDNEGDYSVRPTRRVGAYNTSPFDRGAYLGQFSIKTENCILPVENIFMKWYTSHYDQEVYHVFLKNIAVYPTSHNRDSEYIYTTTLESCMSNTMRLFSGNTGVADGAFWFRVRSSDKKTTILPNSTEEFSIWGDFQPAVSRHVGTLPPEYRIFVDSVINSGPEREYFHFVGRPAGSHNFRPAPDVRDTCS